LSAPFSIFAQFELLTAPAFVAYWTNNGQKAALGLDLSAAIDPKRSQNTGSKISAVKGSE
jgi:hypothetical protein